MSRHQAETDIENKINMQYKIKPKKDQIKRDQVLLCLFGPQILKSLAPICCVHTLCIVIKFCRQVFMGKPTFYFILNGLKKTVKNTN